MVLHHQDPVSGARVPKEQSSKRIKRSTYDKGCKDSERNISGGVLDFFNYCAIFVTPEYDTNTNAVDTASFLHH